MGLIDFMVMYICGIFFVVKGVFGIGVILSGIFCWWNKFCEFLDSDVSWGFVGSIVKFILKICVNNLDDLFFFLG